MQRKRDFKIGIFKNKFIIAKYKNLTEVFKHFSKTKNKQQNEILNMEYNSVERISID